MPADRNSTCTLTTLTTTFDERSNTYSTVEERAMAPSCLRNTNGNGTGSSAARCAVPCRAGPARSATRMTRGVHPSHAPTHKPQQSPSPCCSVIAGVSSPRPARPRPGQPLRVVQQSPTSSPPSSPPPASPLPASDPTPAGPASPSSPCPRVPSRSPIEALARKLRAIPVRSARTVRWHLGGANAGGHAGGDPAADTGGGLGAGLRADHSAISNSSLQEWDRGEGGSSAELAELVQYMGELNQRHGNHAKLCSARTQS
ncbi:hypothetical protein ONE63_002378 [Megalurothrips usitatus]|uniref:Uncharacterized protein n=1 Tax=Megalurothrips usitatus TaxID=439358 RepID=A0AAV7XB04_9NEOP|nr:hypothetical protein ONE63_002378 [Megalurothrips usitatus]